jgi:hypothetical protein
MEHKLRLADRIREQIQINYHYIEELLTEA